MGTVWAKRSLKLALHFPGRHCLHPAPQMAALERRFPLIDPQSRPPTPQDVSASPRTLSGETILSGRKVLPHVTVRREVQRIARGKKTGSWKVDKLLPS